MKKQVTTFIVGMMAIQAVTYAPSASAQVAQPSVIVGGGFVGAPGNYNVNQITQDNTKVMQDVIARTAKIQDADRQYLMSIVTRMNGLTTELIQLRTEMVKLSQQSQTSGFVEFEKYLGIINRIQEKNSVFTAELTALTMITRETLPSYEPLTAGNMQASTAQYGAINMGPVVQKFEVLRNALLTEMNALQFPNLKTRLGQLFPITSNALNPSLQGIKILTSAEIQQYQNEIYELRALTTDTEALQNLYTDRLVTLINNFVQNYGTTEWLRFTDDNDGKARKEAFKQIIDAFYRRSYLRKKTGIRMGAIQTKGFPKQIANTEKFALQPLKEALTSFRRQAAVNDSEIQNAFEAARNFVGMYDEKVTPIFKSKKNIKAQGDKQLEYSSPDVGFLTKVNSAATFLTGQRPTAEVLLAVMRLTLADVREEMMLLQNDGASQISYHDARYRSTEQSKLESNIKLCQIDHALPVAVHEKNCAPLGVKTKAQAPRSKGGNSISEIFGALLDQYMNVEKARREEELMKQTLIDAARQSNQSQGDIDAADDLFN